jgi:chromosome partitioning protein
MIVTFINNKGGVGQSTLAAELAIAWLRERRAVTAIDAHPSRTLSTYMRIRRELHPGPLPRCIRSAPTDPTGLEEARKHGDSVIVDASRCLWHSPLHWLRQSDVALMAMPPGWVEFEQLDVVLRHLGEAQAVKPSLRAAFVITQDNNGRHAADIRRRIEALGFPIIGRIQRAVAFADAPNNGSSVAEYAPRSRAAAEIAHMTRRLDALCPPTTQHDA